MAHAVFQDLVNKAGLSERIQVDSAGLGAWHVGQRAHDGTLDVLRRNDIDHDCVARQIRRDDLNRFDYVLAMDRDNLAGLERLNGGSSAHLSLFLKWANEQGGVRVAEVPDPYYDGAFDPVYRLVVRGCAAFIEYLRREHGL